MVSNNIPQVKLGIIAVSRDCFPIALSTQRRENIVKEYKGEIFNCQTTVENEKDMLKALGEVKEQGCNALVVFLGNFGPETPETLIAKNFDGPCMFVAAATANVIPNIIIMLPFLYFNYSLFNLFECKDNVFLCAHTIFREENAVKGMIS